jgi:hypothetical protein
MLKRIIPSAALAAGLAAVSVASILRDAPERRIEISNSIDTLSLMSQPRDLPNQTLDDPI